MSKKGTRNTNGEGCIYNTVVKKKRKKFLDEECSICKNCTDRLACNNRIGYDKCNKCKECKEECLKYCDRFYCYDINQAQITINGKQTTVAGEKKRKDTVAKKKEVEAQIQTKNYIQKNNITILDLIKQVDNEKEKSGTIGSSSVNSNQFKYKKIEENSILATLPAQKVTYTILQDFFNFLRDSGLSQSEIDKYYHKLSNGFERAVLDKIIAYSDNPMLRVQRVTAIVAKKEVQAFEIEEEKTLIKYICNTNNLIKSYKCKYDVITIRNLILLSLFSLCRIGEIGALDYTKDIDFKNKYFIVDNTLSKDKNSNIILGTTTKTRKKTN